MSKFFIFIVLALIAIAVNGCATISYPNGSTQKLVLLQVGVIVRVVNNCTPKMDFETINGVVLKDLPYGGSQTILMQSMPFSGSNRYLSLVAKGKTDKGEYLGSVVKRFYVNTYQGSRQEIWEISTLRLPGGRGGCLR